jgi:hypothetical protein
MTSEEQFWQEVRCGLIMVLKAIEKRYPVLAPGPKVYPPAKRATEDRVPRPAARMPLESSEAER